MFPESVHDLIELFFDVGIGRPCIRYKPSDATEADILLGHECDASDLV